MAKTITINIDEQIELQFRKIAAIKYGKHKGYLGKALSNALKIWLAKQEEEDIDIQAIAELRNGYKMGKLKYKTRAELHER